MSKEVDIAKHLESAADKLPDLAFDKNGKRVTTKPAKSK